MGQIPNWRIHTHSFTNETQEEEFLDEMKERGYILKHVVPILETKAEVFRMRYYHFTGEEYQETELEKKHRIREWKREGIYDGKL